MSTNLPVVSSEAVSSVGNAWIICRSKSYAGRIYYFNTSTGETVWNLSEPEMQKAKAMTKLIKSQSGFQPDDCPEPVHSPEDDVSQGSAKRTEFKCPNITPAKIYNKQVINNQFTKPYTSSLLNYNVPNGIQLNIPVTPTFNGLWNLASQPIFVAPTPVPQLQHFPNFNEVPVTTTTESLSNRFKNVSSNRPSSKVKFRDCKRKFNPKLNNNGPRQKYFKQHLKNKRKNVDLRLVISSRRSSFNNIDFIQSSGSTHFSNVRNANTNHKNTLRENNYNMLNDDDMWLEENLQSQGKTDKLDATPLKSYFHIENSHLWYIIADSDALLNNVNFLNILLNSDKQCRLIVPQIVMSIIETKATNSRLRTPAHRAAYFISQQIEANLATIVPHNDENEGSTDEKHCIITCCSNLMKQHFHVIILSDSMELNVLKETGEMPILTISEIKKLLSQSQSNEIESIESLKVAESRNIKITIPNTNKKILTSPLEVKTDEVEVGASSELFVSKNVTNKIASPSPNTDLNSNCTTKRNLSPSHENVIKTEKKRKHCKGYNPSKGIDSLDSSTKSTKTSNSKNSNFGSSETVDKVNRTEDTSGNSIKNISNEEISEISNTNREARCGQTSKGKTEEVVECDNVMFEVTGQAMEDYLKMKSDEWVSRFIQIMEEVLAQILQQDPKFVLEVLPPPWTVYEATECIKRKFISDSDTVDAATKLLNVLFEIGGLRGKIKNDLSPEKYMEMYSFGVYLIDALQGILNNSEDLQTAAESLSNLLSDIQNPHLDPSNQDSFADLHLDREIRQDDKNCHQNEINAETRESEELEESLTNTENGKLENTPTTPKRNENSRPESPRVYNFRSNRKRMLQDKEDVVFIRQLDVESSFFSCLELRKHTDNGIFRRILPNTQSEKQESVENNDQTSPEIIAEGDLSNKKEPTFIRNITKCIEFEEKLKENSEVPYDSWTQRNELYEDYEEELDYESMEDGYYMDGEYNYNEEMYESDDNPDDLEPQELPNDNNNVDFKLFVQKMQSNIKGAYSVVHKFCTNSFEKLSSAEMDLDKCDILLAEKTYLFIENLCNTFNRILERESSDSEYKIQEVFENKEFEGVVITGEDIEDYRSFINNCLVQGNVLKESVRLIVDASKEVA